MSLLQSIGFRSFLCTLLNSYKFKKRVSGFFSFLGKPSSFLQIFQLDFVLQVILHFIFVELNEVFLQQKEPKLFAVHRENTCSPGSQVPQEPGRPRLASSVSELQGRALSSRWCRRTGGDRPHPGV